LPDFGRVLGGKLLQTNGVEGYAIVQIGGQVLLGSSDPFRVRVNGNDMRCLSGITPGQAPIAAADFKDPLTSQAAGKLTQRPDLIFLEIYRDGHEFKYNRFALLPGEYFTPLAARYHFAEVSMTDPRVQKLAQVLVQYSLELQPGEEFALRTSPNAEELNLEVYKEAILAGAHVSVQTALPGMFEIFYKYANDAQLDHISPINRLVTESFRAILDIEAEYNTRELSGVDPSRQSRVRHARAALFKTSIDRMSTRDLKWCGTAYPTQALAQEADMSLSDYQDFVYGAGMLNLDDPVAAWKEEAKRQQRLVDWLAGKDQVTIKGKDVDLKLSIRGRLFEGASGKLNFPDGEVYTSPVEESVNGWIRFAYPAIYVGREIIDVELWFEDGKVVKEKASKGQDTLTAQLNTDRGARYLGEWGIGTNYNIQRFTKNMLFDEKIGGTIHLALGQGFPEVNGKNQSGIHWDILCDMAQSEIRADGELFYKDGKFTVGLSD
jgi:aminopeptidase